MELKPSSNEQGRRREGRLVRKGSAHFISSACEEHGVLSLCISTNPLERESVFDQNGANTGGLDDTSGKSSVKEFVNEALRDTSPFVLT